MVGKVEFKLEGLKELEKLLKELGPVPAGRLGVNATKAGARVIAAEARRRAPVVTGRLKKGITVVGDDDLRRSGGTMRGAYVTVKRVPYAHIVEFGSVKMAARSFLRSAADEKAGEAFAKVGENLGQGIVREALRIARRVGANK